MGPNLKAGRVPLCPCAGAPGSKGTSSSVLEDDTWRAVCPNQAETAPKMGACHRPNATRARANTTSSLDLHRVLRLWQFHKAESCWRWVSGHGNSKTESRMYYRMYSIDSLWHVDVDPGWVGVHQYFLLLSCRCWWEASHAEPNICNRAKAFGFGVRESLATSWHSSRSAICSDTETCVIKRDWKKIMVWVSEITSGYSRGVFLSPGSRGVASRPHTASQPSSELRMGCNLDTVRGITILWLQTEASRPCHWQKFILFQQENLNRKLRGKRTRLANWTMQF